MHRCFSGYNNQQIWLKAGAEDENLVQEAARQQSAHACTQLNTSLVTSISCGYGELATSDVTVRAGVTTLRAHKMVLAAQSTLFKAMFQVMSHMLLLE